ncbi:MAG: glycosyltransferase family 39 protein [Candidatus Aminicenantes bacterium]|nr:MAG: glycosyltransferase family 39 protein [Candidatus Aminicenantes bacterium]
MRKALNVKQISFSDPKTWLLLFAFLYMGAFLLSSFIRIFYPYQLTWMEGAMVDHIRWLLAGNTLYGPPAIEFTPYIYAPFYYYFCGIFMKIFGGGFLVPRLVSFISALLLLVLVWRLIKFETRSRFYAFIGVGFAAAFYPLTRCYFDMARVDSFFIFLLFLGIYIMRTAKTSRGIYLSAFVFFLALFTKQQALPVIAAVGIYLFFENFKSCIKFVSTFSLLTILAIFLFQWTSKGWFLFYVYQLPRAHGFLKKFATLIIQDLFLSVPVLLIFVPYMFFKRFKNKENSLLQKKSRYNIYLAFFIGALATSWASRAHAGGTENVLLPVLLSTALLGTTAFWHIELDIKKTGHIGMGFLFFLIALQLLLLVYNPVDYWPRKGHHLANEKFINLIKGFKGKVFIPSMGYIPSMAGKETFAHKTAIYDIMRAKGSGFDKIKENLRRIFQKAIREKMFQAIILRKDSFYLQKMKKYYRLKSRFVVSPSLYVHGYKSHHLDLDVYVPTQ